ncbi:restriction endonuclease [Mitsuaria sp. GD03876]|uniref:restriction endonuclease n=1 Tax=Mitsuaria sp. GD03876 TaxID=2975399 RepID=UPI0024499A16|nr:restriction endonuclease [Mitsuaria sp. GD03876]MDH0863503.1 restriction endonuclease [Mitsuaria sp. GD03876]
MARTRRKSSGEGLLRGLAAMPWWLCLALAVAAYFGLHALAIQPLPKPKVVHGVAQIDWLAIVAMVKGVAPIGQYALPLLLVAASLISAVQGSRRKQALDQSAQMKDAAAIDGMTWHQFELLIGEAFRQKGYTVAEIGGDGPDGGVDLVLRKPSSNGSEMFLVQCKHWKAYKVSVNVVRELYGVMAARGAAGGFVVTSGRFTKEAEAFAEGRNVQLIDGEGLKELLATPRPKERVEPHLERQPDPQDITMVVCPLCSHPMVRRVARRGPNPGDEFWGCSTYPACKGIRKI